MIIHLTDKELAEVVYALRSYNEQIRAKHSRPEPLYLQQRRKQLRNLINRLTTRPVTSTTDNFR